MTRFFSQGIAILCAESPSLAGLKTQLEGLGWQVSACEPASDWPQMQGPRITLAASSVSKDVCWIDTGAVPWPDDLGSDGDAKVSGAHAMGAYGPYACSGGLERALAKCDDLTLVDRVGQHRAFLRLRSTCFFTLDAPPARSQSDSTPVDRAEELGFLLRLAAVVASLPEAIAYFNPNSEILMAPTDLQSLMAEADQNGDYPIRAAISTRVDQRANQCAIVDLLGMAQFDLLDHECACTETTGDAIAAARFLLQLAQAQLDQRGSIHAGDSVTDTQGRIWQAEARASSLLFPERPVIQWRETSSANETAREDASSAMAEQALQVLVGEIETWLPHQQTMRTRAAQWLKSPDFLAAFYDDVHPPAMVEKLIRKQMGKQEAAEVWAAAQMQGVQSPQLWDAYQQLIESGQVCFATTVMANPEFQQRPDESLPSRLLISTHQTTDQIARSGFLASYLFDLYLGDGNPSQHPKLTQIISDDDFQIFRRVHLPESETEGLSCQLIDIQLRKNWMPPETIPFIPVLLLPGPQGAVLQIPWFVAIGAPPPPGSMQPGRWTELTRHRIPQAAPPPQAQSFLGGCWTLFGRITLLLFLIGIVSGVATYFLDPPSSQPTAKPASPPQPRRNRVTSTVQSWSQPRSIFEGVTVATPDNYEPLSGVGGQGSGFLFRVANGPLVAATSRHQFGDPDQAPPALIGPDGLEVSLNDTELMRAEDSQIQLVTRLSGSASCLEYLFTDVLQNGDEVRLLLGENRSVSALLKLPRDFALDAGPVVLTAETLATQEVVAGSSGAPVVHAKTGRVIGVMLAADQPVAPKIIEFETIYLNLKPPTKVPSQPSEPATAPLPD